MDNGTANATMLEVARLLAARRERAAARHPLRVLVGALARALRGLGLVRRPRLARAAPALRRPPQRRLDRRAGRHRLLRAPRHRGRGSASPRAWWPTSPASGPAGRRFSRAGDQSFWGAGVPSAFMSLSGLPKQDTELSRAMERLVGSAGLPVVVAHEGRHGRQDRRRRAGAGHEGLSRLGPALAERAGAAARPRARRPERWWPSWRRCRRRRARASTWRRRWRRRAGWPTPLERAGRRRWPRRREPRLEARQPRASCGCRACWCRSPTPAAIASPTTWRCRIPPLAGLQRARELAALDPDSDAFKFARAALVRERNRAVHALDSAAVGGRRAALPQRLRRANATFTRSMERTRHARSRLTAAARPGRPRPRRRARPRGRRPEARRHADDRPAHRSRLARSEPRDHRARRLGLLQHARGAADARRQDAGQAVAGDLLRGDVAHQGALQAAPGREVPRRHAVQRRRGEVHLRPRAQGHAAGALGQPGRLAQPAPRWWTTSPSTSSPRSPTARSSARWPCTAWASCRRPPCRSWARTSAGRRSAPGRSSSWSGRPTPT